MTTFLMASYVLVWPIVSAIVLAVIWVAMVRDIRSAKEEDRELV